MNQGEGGQHFLVHELVGCLVPEGQGFAMPREGELVLRTWLQALLISDQFHAALDAARAFACVLDLELRSPEAAQTILRIIRETISDAAAPRGGDRVAEPEPAAAPKKILKAPAFGANDAPPGTMKIGAYARRVRPRRTVGST